MIIQNTLYNKPSAYQVEVTKSGQKTPQCSLRLLTSVLQCESAIVPTSTYFVTAKLQEGGREMIHNHPVSVLVVKQYDVML